MPNFIHPGGISALIYALPTVMKMGGGTIYIEDQATLDAVRPLAHTAEIYADFERYGGQPADYSFKAWRDSYEPRKTIAEAMRIEVLPLQMVDFSKQWLRVVGESGVGAVFARGLENRNPNWNEMWHDARNRYPDALFVGTPNEHASFEQQIGPVKYAGDKSLLEVAQIIQGSSVFIGNQCDCYAIAEGLKVKTIQETAERNPDCIFKRPNAHHVTNRAEWDAIFPQTRILLALQFWQGDAGHALDLVRLIVSMEKEKRTDCEFALAPRFDVQPETVAEMAEILSEKFTVHVIPQVEWKHGTGWPEGCNDLWQSLMLQIPVMIKNSKINPSAVLTFEADCVPLRPDWIACLSQEWDRVAAMGKKCFGTVHGTGDGEHINGNAVFHPMIAAENKRLQDSAGSWDYEHRKEFMRLGVDSPLIVQRYADRSDIPFLTMASIRKNGVIPAMLHGVKGDSARRYVRARIEAGWSDVAPVISEPGKGKKTAIFIRSYGKDLEWLGYCLKSLEKFASGFSEIIVALPDNDPACKGVNFHGVKHVFITPECANGYLDQQITKMNADLYTDADFILHVDSDCMATRPFSPDEFFDGQGKPLILIRPWEDAGEAICWKEHTDKALGFDTPTETMCCMPLIHDRRAYGALRADMEKRFAKSMAAIVSDSGRFSEFNALGNFAIKHMASDYHVTTPEKNDYPHPITQRWSYGSITPSIRAEMDRCLA